MILFMNAHIDISILELLSSKICHDLISPIGAVCNGIEFMSEMGADAGDEATGLIAYSAQQASAKLQAYRMAYGAGGADGSIKPEDVHKAIEAIVSPDGKIKQIWDPYGELGYGDDRPDAYCKILICGILLAMDCLPKGGEIDIQAGEGQTTDIIIKGENAAPRDGIDKALTLGMNKSDLTPMYIHSYVSGLIAEHYGFTFSIRSTEVNCVKIIIKLPTA